MGEAAGRVVGEEEIPLQMRRGCERRLLTEVDFGGGEIECGGLREAGERDIARADSPEGTNGAVVV